MTAPPSSPRTPGTIARLILPRKSSTPANSGRSLASAWGLAACLLLMCRFIITGHESFFLNSPPTLRTSRTVIYLNTSYARHPRILFLGSSRFKSCIDTPHIAQALGLPREDVSSISVYSLGPWEAKLLEPIINNNHLSGSPQLVVINIEPWFFYEHVVER